ncbi:stage V sporulation protein AA [Priestia koreensis]|uniref:Stage V sporulation protein AA n=1 Tax=Priestia koreensis TaxID=284581 RepID=A0A0M0KZK8_9BACI|nr:stage V sporulation protein AA [Priestia koreensis]KOO44037.1 stage V sporulation protein AA [Priestia koreensis]
MQPTIYLRMRHRIRARSNEVVKIEKLVMLVGEDALVTSIASKDIYQITPSDKNIVIIDVMNVIQTIHQHYPDVDVQTIGPSETIVEVLLKKRNYSPFFFVLVWLLLFIGAALAIMNFHEDVSMQQVHQKLFYILTGVEDEKPLLLQIPYSIGLGMGMILFFNHLFRKRINEEPSPLEVEMFNYQQDLDQYVIRHESQEKVEKKP